MIRIILAAILLGFLKANAQIAIKEVRDLLEKSSAGNMSARAEVAWHYFVGAELPENKERAWELITSAVESGDPHAYYRLSCLWIMDKSKGTQETRYNQSGMALEKAANLGHARACYEMGYSHYIGDLNFPKNVVLAYKWTALGIDREYSESSHRFLLQLESAMTKQQVEEGLRLANEHKGAKIEIPKPPLSFAETMEAANKGDPKAQNEVGVSYQNGIHTEKNNTIAVEWFAKSAAQGDPDGLSNLGYHYAYGLGVEADPLKGAQYSIQAAEKGEKYAAVRAAEFYAKGIGVSRDRSRAYQWYLVAENRGSDVGSAAVDRLERELTPDEIARGQRLATEIIEKINAKALSAPIAEPKTDSINAGLVSKADQAIEAAGGQIDKTLWIVAGVVLLIALMIAANSVSPSGSKGAD